MRKLMWFSLGFAIACALGVYCLPSVWTIPLIAVFFLTFPVLWRVNVRRLAAICLGCGVGLLWFLLFQRYYLLPAQAMDGVTLETTVTATDYSYETTYGVGVDGEFELDGKVYQVRLYVNEARQLQPGDQISGSFKLQYTAPGGTNDAAYYAGERILFLGYQRGAVQIIQDAVDKVIFFAADLRHRIQQVLRAAFPEDVFPFTQALLLGDSTELDYETDTAFRVSGIRHIIAVSGLHVAILYSMITAVTFHKRYLTAALGIAVLGIFSAVAGFTPSVTRACMMVALMMLSQVFNREYDPPTALAFAALVMLVINPLVITSVSFQMSVGSVAGILLFNEPISSWMKRKLGEPKGKGLRARLKRWFISSVSATLSAISLTTPLCAYYFGTVSLIGVVTNLLTLWVVSLIFNGLVIVCLVSLLSMKTAALIGAILAWPIRYVVLCAKWLSMFPLAAVYTKSDYIVAWLVFAYVLLAVFLLQKRRRPLVLFCCAVIGLCAALLASWLEPLRDDVRLTALDVGQGQSLILQHQGKNYLIDCGGSNDESAANLAAETLLSQGITRLDGIILTHTDRDHAGGIPYLLTRIETDWLMLPATAEPDSVRLLTQRCTGEVLTLADDLRITIGETEITVFGPTFAAESNENSLCVLFESENCAILVTGDRGSLGELLLLHEAELPQVDLLIAGHHGSKYSTSERLLQAVRPETVFISVGADNAYGHPAEELLARLEEFGCAVYRTDENGTILFRR